MITALIQDISINVYLKTSIGCSLDGSFFMGYIESCDSRERSENNRVLFNMTSKSGQVIALTPGPRYRDVKVMPFEGWDK